MEKTIYVSEKTGRAYPLKDDETIDLHNEITFVDFTKYKFMGRNSLFKIYQLKNSNRKIAK